MLFPTHLVAAYVLGRWLQLPIVPILIGATLPDVIDKPLAMFGLVDLYHSIGHSLIALGILSLVLLFGERWIAFWIGWASHLVLDALQMVLNGRVEDIQFLFWPFVHHQPAVGLPPIQFAIHYVGTPAFWVEIVIWILFFAVMLHSGQRKRTH